MENGKAPENKKLAERFSSLDNSTIDEFYLAHMQEGESYAEHTGGFTFAQIDIVASDEQLIEDFKQWLKDTRSLVKIEARPKTFTETDAENWHKKRILPYIDLTIWAKLKGISITHQEIGIVLFPDEYNVALGERVRRTVKPLVDMLMRPSTLCAIASQVGLFYY